MTKFIDFQNAIDHSKQSRRLVFIDLMRAYAILMMLQGHTIGAVLAPEYQDNSLTFYYLWNFMRGITAPVFFFSSGTIFAYLLLRKDLPFWQNERAIKGVKRGFFLLFVGYLLRFNPDILSHLGDFDVFSYQASVAVDTLHCIGVGLISLVLLYGVQKLVKFPVWLSYPLLGAFLFLIYPKVFHTNWLEHFPLPIANYFTANYGSNFPIVPWMGFILFGGFYGYILSKSAKIAYNTKFSLLTIAIGVITSIFSGFVLGEMYNVTKLEDFLYLQYHNVQFFHLGNVLIIVGILSIIANKFEIPEFLSTVGKKTMMIYIAHIFIVYGTGINKGYHSLIGQTLEPYGAITLAIVTVLFFIVLSQYTDKIKEFALGFIKNVKAK
ncbi:MAG TPA: heparan-alpha-glucosaminide N-acetyltransferase domain-containing protein [Candidatus Kapabacteria bacterium]|nr:heparan-alpha-glucosaminide N-acetyltransferase domain-containing protein [Candidatus Kapabacteria bacterium]